MQDLFVEHAPQITEGFGAEIAVLVAFDVVLLTVGECQAVIAVHAVHPRIDSTDDELAVLADELRIALVDDVGGKIRHLPAKLRHSLVIFRYPVRDGEHMRRRELWIIDKLDEKVVHKGVVDVCIRVIDLPFLRHRPCHALLYCEQIIEEPFHLFG